MKERKEEGGWACDFKSLGCCFRNLKNCFNIEQLSLKSAVSVSSDPISTYNCVIKRKRPFLLAINKLASNVMYTDNERNAASAKLANLHILL